MEAWATPISSVGNERGHVLVVHPNADRGHALAATLREGHVDVVELTTGEQLLDALVQFAIGFQDARIDAIVAHSDIALGGNLDLLLAIRRSGWRIPYLCVCDDDATRGAAGRSGATVIDAAIEGGKLRRIVAALAAPLWRPDGAAIGRFAIQIARLDARSLPRINGARERARAR